MLWGAGGMWDALVGCRAWGTETMNPPVPRERHWPGKEVGDALSPLTPIASPSITQPCTCHPHTLSPSPLHCASHSPSTLPSPGQAPCQGLHQTAASLPSSSSAGGFCTPMAPPDSGTPATSDRDRICPTGEGGGGGEGLHGAGGRLPCSGCTLHPKCTHTPPDPCPKSIHTPQPHLRAPNAPTHLQTRTPNPSTPTPHAPTQHPAPSPLHPNTLYPTLCHAVHPEPPPLHLNTLHPTVPRCAP